MALIAIPLTLLWLALTKQYTVEGIILGYVISFSLVWFTVRDFHLNYRSLPAHIWGLLQFLRLIAVDTLVAGGTVAWRVLQPTMPFEPGLVEVDIDDDNEIVAALSAYAITITPGEMVVDFKNKDNKRMMVVHTLNKPETEGNAEDDQMRRLKILRRMLNLE